MSTSEAIRSRANARREREREIVAATRRVFDDRGLQDAPIEEIAKGVGINKALIYRHFESKEELYMATLVDYLAELCEPMAAGAAEQSVPARERLTTMLATFIDFGLRYPAFLDCAFSLMRRPANELSETVSEAMWLRLGQGMASVLGPLSRVLGEGVREGVFVVGDPNYAASQLYAQILGMLHLARVGLSVCQGENGVPRPFAVSREQVREGALSASMASVLEAH